jgi:hypothetical protein
LAKATNTPVLFMPAEIPTEIQEPTVTADAAVVLRLKEVPVKALQPTGEEVQLAVVVTPPPAIELRADAAPVVAMLPATSSPLALFAILGLLALGGAVGFKMLQKRIL